MVRGHLGLRWRNKTEKLRENHISGVNSFQQTSRQTEERLWCDEERGHTCQNSWSCHQPSASPQLAPRLGVITFRPRARRSCRGTPRQTAVTEGEFHNLPLTSSLTRSWSEWLLCSKKRSRTAFLPFPTLPPKPAPIVYGRALDELCSDSAYSMQSCVTRARARAIHRVENRPYPYTCMSPRTVFIHPMWFSWKVPSVSWDYHQQQPINHMNLTWGSPLYRS